MKKYPNCKQIYSDDVQFCLADGTALSVHYEDSASEETIFMRQPIFTPTPPGINVPTKNHSQSLLFALTGGLVVLVGIMAWMLLSVSTNKKSDSEGRINDEQIIKKDEANTAPTQIVNNISAEQKQKPFDQTPAPQVLAASVNPGGKWTGNWNSKTTSFKAEMNLTVDNSGKAKGQILWLLLNTTSPQKVEKIGMSAVEYVQGTFDPATRMLYLSGYRKEDPNNIIVLDKYSLNLAEDNQRLGGVSKSSGQFNLSR